MSFFSFNLIGNALDAFSSAENVTSNNIANVATPGASRQEAIVQEQTPIDGSAFYASNSGGPGTLGEGAVVNQISRIHQNSYDGLFRGASSSQYFYTLEQQQLTSLQSNFGEPSNGVSTAFAALQSAISNVASSPTSVQVRQTVLDQAQTFAQTVNSASAAITSQENATIAQGTDLVTTANTLIDQIASLNGQIRSLTAAGDSPNTYLDQRDTDIDSLAQIVPTTTSLQPNGSVFVSIDGRQVVSDTVTYHLAPPVIGTASDGTSQLVVGFAGDPDPSNPVAIPLASAQLGAVTDVYNNKLAPYAQQLNNFATATASEVNRITEAGVDLNGNHGLALFTGGAGSSQITAANLSVAITDPTQLPLGLISTSAGSLTQAVNSADNTVQTTTAIDGYASLFNPPPAGGLTGSLTINVDGATQTFAYNTAAGGNADTIGDFVTNFNAGHYGITASFDATAQKIVFTRDPNNTDLVHRAKQGGSATTAGFTITDSNGSSGNAQGDVASSLLQALGAASLSGVAQTPANAYGAGDNGAANALLTLFSKNVGVGALQTTVTSAVPAVPTSYPSSVTITPPTTVPATFATIYPGQVLAIVNAATGTTQNCAVTAVDRLTGTITLTATAQINAGDAVTTAPTQTLGASYQALVTQMGLDAATANTGVTTQSSLASSIDAARQSVDGINIDEETQNLLKFQNAYSAAAKTLTTLNAIEQDALGLITS